MTRPRLGRRGLAALLLGGVLAGSVPGAAVADTASEGLWYFDALNVQDAHDAGFTGEGVTIAVLDSAINPDIPTLRGADLQLGEQPECYLDGAPAPVESTDVESATHATNVVSLLVGTGAGEGGVPGVKGVAPDATVVFYRIGRAGDLLCEDADGEPRYEESIADGLNAAIDAGADIISLSIGFNLATSVSDAVARGLAKGVIFVSALSNQDEGSFLTAESTFLNGGIGVQAIDIDAQVPTTELFGHETPNTDLNVDVAAPGLGILFQGTAEEGWAGQSLSGGTSLATPIVAGFLAVTASKYPEATSNQLIQSLIRNTGVDDHELVYDERQQLGYGVVSLTHLLRVDPTQYPDENPLLTADGFPSPEKIAAAAEPTASPDPGPTEPSSVLPLVLGIAGGLLLLAVVAVVIVLLVARRTRRSREAGK